MRDMVWLWRPEQWRADPKSGVEMLVGDRIQERQINRVTTVTTVDHLVVALGWII
jgi:hypothetical protein